MVPRISSAPAICAAVALAEQALLIAVVQIEAAVTVPPRVFFGSSTSFIPLGRVTRMCARFDVGGRRIERFALLDRGLALVIFESGDEIRRWRGSPRDPARLRE